MISTTRISTPNQINWVSTKLNPVVELSDGYV
jgi:hypothetical protein